MEWNYKANLERARKEGLIREDLNRTLRSSHFFPHLESFNRANARDLAPEMLPFLSLMLAEEGAYGELGGGSGKALSDVSTFMGLHQHSHNLVNISATAIDPFTRLRFSLRPETSECVILSEDGIEAGRGTSLSYQDLLEIQNSGRGRIIEALEHPYIHDQRIGVFPGEIDLTGLGKKFLWLYDFLGAFYYATTFADRDERPRVYAKINDLVSENGIFLSVNSIITETYAKDLMDHAEEGDSVIFDHDVILLARKRSLALNWLKNEFPETFDGKNMVHCKRFRKLLTEAPKKLQKVA